MVLQLTPPLSRPTSTATAEAGTFLSPDDPFPSALAELDLVELQVLHSRVCRRLEHEYLTAPDGPHPVTQDRCQELVAELDVRESYLVPPVPVTASVPERGPGLPAEPEPTPRPQSTTGTAGAVIHDLTQISPGERIEVWRQGHVQYRGTVEEVCPALGVTWLLEAGDGYRRMIHVQDAELRRHVSSESR